MPEQPKVDVEARQQILARLHEVAQARARNPPPATGRKQAWPISWMN